MSGVQTLIVTEDDGDQRLDRWFRRHFPNVGQGRIEKLCRKGEIRVDGGRVKSNTRLETGQKVRIPPLPDNDKPKPSPNARISKEDAALIQTHLRRQATSLGKDSARFIEYVSGSHDRIAPHRQEATVR